jgi:hypothetical protein
MRRKKSRNPFGLSTLSCALAGAGLYLLYRKFKGLGDGDAPSGGDYALEIPTLPVPSEAPASQARAMAARQPSRAVRSRVAQAYAPVQAEQTTEDSIFGLINAIAKDLSDKALAKPTVVKRNYNIYEPGQFDITGKPALMKQLPPKMGVFPIVSNRPMTRDEDAKFEVNYFKELGNELKEEDKSVEKELKEKWNRRWSQAVEELWSKSGKADKPSFEKLVKAVDDVEDMWNHDLAVHLEKQIEKAQEKSRGKNYPDTQEGKSEKDRVWEERFNTMWAVTKRIPYDNRPGSTTTGENWDKESVRKQKDLVGRVGLPK